MSILIKTFRSHVSDANNICDNKSQRINLQIPSYIKTYFWSNKFHNFHFALRVKYEIINDLFLLRGKF